MIGLFVEFNVMLILTTIPDVIGVIMKYVSLAGIVNVPRLYFASLTSEHVLVKVKEMKLPITKYRTRDQTLMDRDPETGELHSAPFGIHVLRFVNKFFRLLYASWTYYFMPFTSALLTMCRFGFRECKCWGPADSLSDAETCPRAWYPACAAAEESDNNRFMAFLSKY